MKWKHPLYCRHCFIGLATLRILNINKCDVKLNEFWCYDCMNYRPGLTTIQIADAINFFETTGVYDHNYHNHSGGMLTTHLPSYEAFITRGTS